MLRYLQIKAMARLYTLDKQNRVLHKIQRKGNLTVLLKYAVYVVILDNIILCIMINTEFRTELNAAYIRMLIISIDCVMVGVHVKNARKVPLKSDIQSQTSLRNK